MGKVMGCAETFISFMGGNRSFPVAGNMDDRRHRLNGLESGDIALFRQATDYLQMHFTGDGGFWSAALDKTVRMALINKNSGQQQQSIGGTPGAQQMDASGGGGSSGAGGQGGQQQQNGQKSVKKDNQQSKMFVHVTKDEAAMSGTNVRQYGADGNGYHEVNQDGNVYTGGLKGKGTYALVVTLKGPTKNVMGKIG